MLGKLMKHEWKSTYKVSSMIILGIIAVTVIGCIMLQIPTISSTLAGGTPEMSGANITWMILGIMSFILCIFMFLGATYGLMVYFGIRFYKTMYSGQGYLTNTLPVTAHQLLISKVVVTGTWYLLLEIVMYISGFALFMFLSGSLIGMGGSGGDWISMQIMLAEMTTAFEEAGMDLTHYIIVMVLMTLIGPFTALTTLYGSLTLGQLSKKYKAVMGIVAYFGVVFINMIIGTIVQFVTTMSYTFEMIASENPDVMPNVNATYDASLIVTIIIAVILYIASHYILTKKLNLD